MLEKGTNEKKKNVKIGCVVPSWPAEVMYDERKMLQLSKVYGGKNGILRKSMCLTGPRSARSGKFSMVAASLLRQSDIDEGVIPGYYTLPLACQLSSSRSGALRSRLRMNERHPLHCEKKVGYPAQAKASIKRDLCDDG